MDLSEINCKPAKTDNVLPAAFWGLDSTFRSYLKMYITDILALKAMHLVPGVFCHGRRPVCKVDVLGLVVSVAHRELFSVYAVDDGTGVINCKCWHKKDQNVTDVNEELPSELTELLEGLKPMGDKLCNLGDLLHVRGAVKDFRGQREISAYYYASVNDRMHEALRMASLPPIQRAVYDRLPKLPRGVLRDKSISKSATEYAEVELTEVESLQRLQDEHQLQHIIISHLTTSKVDTVKPKDLLNITSVKEFQADKMLGDNKILLMKIMLERMSTQGFLFPDKSSSYIISENHEGLRKVILTVLRQDAAKPQYAESGCHIDLILKRVRANVHFSEISAPALLRCLQILEGQSEVISVTDVHYLYMGQT